jgi:hypothetical protein
MDLGETECKGMGWMQVAQGRVQLEAFMKFSSHKIKEQEVGLLKALVTGLVMFSVPKD